MNKTSIRISAVLLALTLWIGLLPLSVSAATSYKLIDHQSQIKTQGRTAWVGDSLMLDWSIAGIEFTAECQGEVAVTFDVKSITDPSAKGGVYFTFVVDGVAQPRDTCRFSKVGTADCVVATGLSAGKHTFAIYRQTEHDAGAVGIRSIQMNGTLLDAPKQKDLYIEFIGDSITAAFGNLGDANTEDGGKPLYQDATQGYAYLVAKELNADFSSVCWSGIGCKYGYGSISMQDVYPYVRYRYDKNTQHDFSARQPDVVVLALGTNDNSNQSNAQLKRAGLVEMLDMVRAKNPNAKILWICNMMTGDVNKMIEEIVAEKGGYKKGYYVAVTPRNNSGAGWHPSLQGQKSFADSIVKVMKEQVLNPNYNGPTTTTVTYNWGAATTTEEYHAATTATTTGAAVDGEDNTTVQNGENTTVSGEDNTTQGAGDTPSQTTTTLAPEEEDSDPVQSPVSGPFMWVAIGLAGLAVAAVIVVIVLLVTDKKKDKKAG